MHLYRKIKKLIKNPPVFFRDYLNKRYPLTYTELKISETTEAAFIEYSEKNLVTTTELLPVDVVFTWVNNQDKKWQQRYQMYATSVDINKFGQYATDTARFDNHNELYYAVLSVKKYLSWIRKIFIVTDNQIPTWVDEFNNITIIDHKDIIDHTYLPTFNSHVIEAFLHKIPNLSENFIYFNDDVFVARSLPKEHFFSANNLASIFISSKKLETMMKKNTKTPTMFAMKKSIELINKHYNQNIQNGLVHTYFPLKKSIYKKAWELFEDDIREFLPNKFRGNNDINMATFLIPWLMYYEGKATERIDICYYFNIRSYSATTYYKRLLQLKSLNASPHSFCANDFNTKTEYKNYQENLIDMLQKYFNITN